MSGRHRKQMAAAVVEGRRRALVAVQAWRAIRRAAAEEQQQLVDGLHNELDESEQS